MKKIVAIVGSPRAGDTYHTVQAVGEKLKALCECDFECIELKDADIQPCRGCLTCVAQGEELCPLRDDMADIMQKMLSADGIIFATPVYSLQISGQMKLFIDRIAYIFHRPCLFDKAFLGIAVQAINGQKDALAYLNKIAHQWGLATAPGLAVNAPPGFRSARLLAKNMENIEKAAKDFHALLVGGRLKSPKWMDFIMFRMTRSFMPYLPFMARDCVYYREKGWMESDYYYPTKLWFGKRLAGKFFDLQGRKLGEKLQARRIAETQAFGPEA